MFYGPDCVMSELKPFALGAAPHASEEPRPGGTGTTTVASMLGKC